MDELDDGNGGTVGGRDIMCKFVDGWNKSEFVGLVTLEIPSVLG